MSPDLTVNLIVIGLVIYATSLHEMAHAFIATWLGDPTPGHHGRLTFNPIPHLNPPLTAVVMPVLFYLFGGSLFCLATTPINPSRFRKPMRDHALVALGGPMMNLVFMGILIGILWIPGVFKYDPDTGYPANYLTAILPMAAFWNMILAVFNLLPIPPLDGYWIARGILPLKLRMQTDALARNPAALLLAMFAGGALLSYVLPYVLPYYFRLLPPRFGF